MGNYQVRFGGERLEKELSVTGKNLARRLPNFVKPEVKQQIKGK